MIIAFGGDDTIIAGDREDDVLGGSGNDTIDLGVAADTLTGVDGFSDDVNAECTFKENGTDTVTWYDDEPGESGIYDVSISAKPSSSSTPPMTICRSRRKKRWFR